MSITDKILPTGDVVEVKSLRKLYNQALGEKVELERELSLLKIGNHGRVKLQVEIAKLQDILISTDERIHLIVFYEYEQRKAKQKIQLRANIYKIEL